VLDLDGVAHAGRYVRHSSLALSRLHPPLNWLLTCLAPGLSASQRNQVTVTEAWLSGGAQCKGACNLSACYSGSQDDASNISHVCTQPVGLVYGANLVHVHCSGHQHAAAESTEQVRHLQILLACPAGACGATPSTISVPSCCQSPAASPQPGSAAAAGAAAGREEGSCNILVVAKPSAESVEVGATPDIATAEAGELQFIHTSDAQVQQAMEPMAEVLVRPPAAAVTPPSSPSKYLLTLLAGVLLGAWLSTRFLAHGS
jgi:hypothetical protein